MQAGGPVYFVLAVPPASDVSRAAQALAATLGGHAIDRRPALLRELPFVPLRTVDLAQAQQVAAAWTAAGLPCHVLHERALAAVPEPLVATRFQLAPDALVAADRQREVRLPWAEVWMAVRARSEHAAETRTETTRKTTHVAALAVGLPIRTRSTEVEYARQTDTAFFTVLWTADAGVRLDQDGLDYTGLGAAMTPSSLSNYQLLLQRLQAACPQARWDVRLEKAGSRLATAPVEFSQGGAQREGKATVRTSVQQADNADAVWQAARLLWLAEKRRRMAA